MIKTKGDDDDLGNLFFAEVTRKDHKDYALSRICMLQSDDNGQCYGCTCTGRVDMKHPSDENYRHGDPNTPLPCMGFINADLLTSMSEWTAIYNEDELKAQGDRVRLECKMLYDPDSARGKEDTYFDGQRRTAKYVVPSRRLLISGGGV
ncbi:hypothetical protein VPH35_055629 [Triticum aestivum]